MARHPAFGLCVTIAPSRLAVAIVKAKASAPSGGPDPLPPFAGLAGPRRTAPKTMAAFTPWVQSARVPMLTETGYKSLFLPFGEVEHAGGVVAYVTLWLNAAALKSEWKAIERDRRQGCLF